MRLLTLCVAGLFMQGCAGTPEPGRSLPYAGYKFGNLGNAKVDLHNTGLVKRRLFELYRQWKGTRYVYGGLSKRGVDCSGLVQIAYLSALGITLPRTTRLQVRLGREIGQDEMIAGDLVFFKTGYFDRHVGIYMGNGQFFHASRSKGVTISSLDNSYWADNYWVSRRIY